MSTSTLHLIQGKHSFASRREGFALECGGVLRPVTLRYAIYGEPNAACDNVVLVCHALSGSAEVAAWWPEMFDDPRLFGNDRYCILCSNIIGSCYGSTGPAAINPQTGKPYGASFPLVTIGDMVRAQRELLRVSGNPAREACHRRLHRRHAGAAVGNRLSRTWLNTAWPSARLRWGPWDWRSITCSGRQSVSIPKWNGGEYSQDDPPSQGLALARDIAMCSYKSAELFGERFGRNPNRNGEDPGPISTDAST